MPIPESPRFGYRLALGIADSGRSGGRFGVPRRVILVTEIAVTQERIDQKMYGLGYRYKLAAVGSMDNMEPLYAKTLSDIGPLARQWPNIKFDISALSDTVYDYRVASACLKWLIDDMKILAGDEVGSSTQSWQDVANNLATNLRDYANILEAAVAGKVRNGPAVFPSPDDE